VGFIGGFLWVGFYRWVFGWFFLGGFFYCQPWFEDEGLGVFVGPEIPAELVEAGIPEIEDHGAIQAYQQNICPFLRVEEELRIRIR
jgi:hypothetical protein